MTALAEVNPHAARDLSQAWKKAIATGGAIAMSPVAILVFVLVAASAFPLLILALPLMAGAWARALRWEPVPARGSAPLRAAVAG